jgi:glycosyltransferase involved in cell wall biosynthesis
MDEAVKVLYFSIDEWGNMGRRKPRLAYEFSCQPDVASVMYVCPPVPTSLLDLVRGRSRPTHRGTGRIANWLTIRGVPDQVADRLWVYTGTNNVFPLTRFQTARRWLTWLKRLNHRLYLDRIRASLTCLPGERLVVWLNHPVQVEALDAFAQRALLCCDWTDDWMQFDWQPVDNHDDLVAWNDRILHEADLVFAVSEKLVSHAQALNDCVYLAPNATDMQVLGDAAVPRARASDVAWLPRPVIGYVGQMIAERMDLDLIRFVAKARSEWSFVFVGSVVQHCQQEFHELAQMPNVHFLGRRPYGELPTLVNGFDVCIIPHVANELTRSMDPIKLYDYLATGKPIVTTDVAGVDRFSDVLHIAHTPSDFLSGLDRAVREDGRLCERRVAYARENTWPKRGAQIWELVRGHLG